MYSYNPPGRRRRRVGTAALLLLILPVLFVAVAIDTWLLMLLVGAVHGSLLPSLKPAGFWVCMPIAFLLTLVFGGAAKARS